MSKKRLKVNFNKGGNGGVPITMVRELGIDEENKFIDVVCEDGKIIIVKSETQE